MVKMTKEIKCPKCDSFQYVKSGIVNERQRYKCKDCKYYYSVNKLGKKIDDYYIIKAMQLYIEGISAREIERLLGISHVSVHNWAKKIGIQKMNLASQRPTYKVFNHNELVEYMQDRQNLNNFGAIITEVGDKFMMIRWERFKD